MAVRRAPATLCPISSPLSPSLTFLFWTLFLLPFFFSLCFVIPMLYLLCQRNPTPLPLLFHSSHAVPPRPTDISISTFVALLNFHIATLLRNYVPQRCSALYFSFLSDSAVANDPSNSSSISRSFTFVGLLGKRVGKQRVIIKTISAKSSPLHLRYGGTPFAVL